MGEEVWAREAMSEIPKALERARLGRAQAKPLRGA